MNKLMKLRFYIDALCLYNIKDDAVISKLCELLENAQGKRALLCYSSFFKSLSSPLKSYVSNLVLTDDNAFTRAAAAGKTGELSPSVISALGSDLKKLEEIASLTFEDILGEVKEAELNKLFLTMPKFETGEALPPLSDGWENCVDALARYHKNNGYGEFAKYCAFTWRNGDLTPITAIDKIVLSDLKNYESQRMQVVENTASFLKGLPANNILLYGDRGTGKSSTIHAVLNEYKNQGLRMIEISKGDINDLTLIRERIAQSPMKFIIFIDDLSFDSHDDAFGELKAALEGSLSGRQSNTVIYATSNRRHLIKESFSDRENDVHRSDTMQEELSLSDRFGLSVYFMNPDKAEYLDITEKIAMDRKIDFDMDRLLEGAESWARRRGGRSPRCAKQFIDYVEACERLGKSW